MSSAQKSGRLLRKAIGLTTIARFSFVRFPSSLVPTHAKKTHPLTIIEHDFMKSSLAATRAAYDIWGPLENNKHLFRLYTRTYFQAAVRNPPSLLDVESWLIGLTFRPCTIRSTEQYNADTWNWMVSCNHVVQHEVVAFSNGTCDYPCIVKLITRVVLFVGVCYSGDGDFQ